MAPTPTDSLPHLLDLTPDDLRAALDSAGLNGIAPYRADQIFEWVCKHHTLEFEGMTTLPIELRRALAARFEVVTGAVASVQDSADGTTKVLLRWPAGGTSEFVLIPDGHRWTVCVSTQVGCPVRCAFCASGVGGLERNLSSGEIVEQALRAAVLARRRGGHLTNVVFMGLGEPLANYDATMRGLRAINAAWGLGIGARRITVSTVGLPSQMRRLAGEQLQITLALSLHAPSDALRRKLIPWARRVGMGDLIEACRYYFDHTGREVTLEYILLDGVNNLPNHARELAAVSGRMRSNINLIPYNPVADLGFQRPTAESVLRFQAELRNLGANAHVRRSRGLDIDAACGQLRRRNLEQPKCGPSTT